MDLAMIMVVALFIEAVVTAVKPLWNSEADRFTVTEIVSMVIGVVVACLCKIDLLGGVVSMAEYGVVVEYLFYAMTGVALGRGPSFVYDLWQKIREHIS